MGSVPTQLRPGGTVVRWPTGCGAEIGGLR
jgi:hypothetical protein